jgi:hypothetical protein
VTGLPKNFRIRWIGEPSPETTERVVDVLRELLARKLSEDASGADVAPGAGKQVAGPERARHSRPTKERSSAGFRP